MVIGVICNDARMQQVADALASSMHVIYIDEKTDYLALPMLDVFVMPLKGMDMYNTISFANKQVHIPSAFWNVQGEAMRIFCGLPCESLRNKKQDVYFYMLDEEVKKANAVLTAEGVLYAFIACICKSMYAVQVDVVGYGCCGKEIYKLMQNLHVSVRVIRRDCVAKKNILPFANWDMCGDVIINTAPKAWLSKDQLEKWKKPFVLLDIASDAHFDTALMRTYGITYEKLPNLPGRFACVSAGNIIADCIRRKCCEK